MTNRKRINQRPRSGQTVRLFGRDLAPLERLRIRGRSYLLLERLSTDRRERYLGFDPGGGPRGGAVMVLRLPRSETGTPQHLDILQRKTASNENLPAILDFEVQRDHVLLVFRWVQGVTLARYLAEIESARQRPISTTIAVQRIRGLAHGLSRWHLRGQWTHGDIKPDNIIVSTDPGRFVLIDFGSAWCDQNAAVRDRGDGFNPFYAAPELQSPREVSDSRSDQFSLSVVLYQLLTGQIPYEGLGGKAGVGGVETVPLTPPSLLVRDRNRIPSVILQGIDRVVSRGLALDPDERYPTPHSWTHDLDAVDLDIRRPPSATDSHRILTRVIGWISDRLK